MTSPTAEKFSTVSVIIPCYNAEPYVVETIRSVLSQTYRAIELIAVDDASTDGSWAVLESFRNRVKAIRLPGNRGGSHARNRGAELATGSFLMFLDADDLLTPDSIASLVDALQNEQNSIAISPWRRLVRKGESWVTAPADVPLPNTTKDPLYGWISGSTWVPPCAVLWRRDVFDRVGGWDEQLTYNDDGELMMRALAEGVALVASESGESYYRSHGNTRVSVGTNLFTERNLRSGMRVLEKLSARLGSTGAMGRYAPAIGIAYKKLGQYAFQHGHVELGRECVAIGERHAGARTVSPNLLGRLLERLLGMEMKERIARILTEQGIRTRGRRLLAGRAEAYARHEERPPADS